MPADEVLAALPDRVWYLTQSGRDMWCRRPYGFFFTSSDQAIAFAQQMKTELELQPIGIASKELVSDEGLASLRELQLTRLFIDPRLDEQTGDVFGTIVRLAESH